MSRPQQIDRGVLRSMVSPAEAREAKRQMRRMRRREARQLGEDAPPDNRYRDWIL